MNKRILVAYFSASGVTAGVARELAAALDADLHEIKPAAPYTAADLDWRDKKSRSSVEMQNPAFRPAIVDDAPDMAGYDAVLVGFPIWWYVAPTVVNTFLESRDFAGKIVVPFATSGSSGMGDTNAHLLPSCPGADLRPGKLLKSGRAAQSISEWAQSLAL